LVSGLRFARFQALGVSTRASSARNELETFRTSIPTPRSTRGVHTGCSKRFCTRSRTLSRVSLPSRSRHGSHGRRRRQTPRFTLRAGQAFALGRGPAVRLFKYVRPATSSTSAAPHRGSPNDSWAGPTNRTPVSWSRESACVNFWSDPRAAIGSGVPHVAHKTTGAR